MGTRSCIGYVEDGVYNVVYCHWDGYLSYNGIILNECYNTLEKVKALVSLGDISSLNKTIDAPEGHTFDKPVEGCTTFYGRDRGEKGVEPRQYFSLSKFLDSGAEYNAAYYYIFKDGEWYYCRDGFSELNSLKDALVGVKFGD